MMTGLNTWVLSQRVLGEDDGWCALTVYTSSKMMVDTVYGRQTKHNQHESQLDFTNG